MVSLNSIEILTNTTQAATALQSTSVTSNEEEEVSIVNAMGNGDTVEISNEARESYAAVQAAGGAAEATNETGIGGETQTTGTPPAGAAAGASGSEAGGSTVGSSGSETESSDSDVTDLEQEIASLREEIASLMAEAETGGGSQGELSVKQAELAALLAELSQMQMA